MMVIVPMLRIRIVYTMSTKFSVHGINLMMDLFYNTYIMQYKRTLCSQLILTCIHC